MQHPGRCFTSHVFNSICYLHITCSARHLFGFIIPTYLQHQNKYLKSEHALHTYHIHHTKYVPMQSVWLSLNTRNHKTQHGKEHFRCSHNFTAPHTLKKNNFAVLLRQSFILHSLLGPLRKSLNEYLLSTEVFFLKGWSDVGVESGPKQCRLCEAWKRSGVNGCSSSTRRTGKQACGLPCTRWGPLCCRSSCAHSPHLCVEGCPGHCGT